MKKLKKRTKTLILLTLFAVVSSIFVYKGDSNYLKQISADQAWIDFSKDLSEIVKKGDLVIYEEEQKDSYKFQNYKKRIAYNVELLNLKNAPKIRNVYALETKFILDGNNLDSIVFKIKEKNTNYLVETKTIKIKKITPKSIIPVLLTLIFAIITLKPILSLIVGLLSSVIIHFNGDIFLGLHKILTSYIPSFFNSSSLYLLFFIFFMHLFILILKQINTKETTNPFKKYLSFILLSIEPLLSLSLGNFILNKKETNLKYKDSFINHFLSMGLFSILIFSPLLIFSLLYINNELNVLSFHISFTNLFLNLLKYRFTSFSLIMISFLFIYRNKKQKENTKINFRKSFKSLFRSSIIFYFLIFYLISLITGILKIDYSENLKSIIEIINIETIDKILNKNYLISYLSSINLNISILVSTLITLILTVIISFKKQILNIKKMKEKTKESLSKTYKLLIIFFLSYIYTCAIKDLNSHYYIISLFKFAITKELFFLIVFLISSLISIFLSSYISSIIILTPLIVPIASQINLENSIVMTIAAILEGAIIGELVSPFSNTSIVLSSVKKLNPTKHIKNQLKYVAMVFLFSLIPGFLLIGVIDYFYINYLIITLLSFIFLFSFKKQEN
jgi:Na+/H+ antiporter NhaC